ncbi:MAG: ABC transporter ATP-binding protein, partial [Candidatus Altimarinota bacterium]
MKQTKNPPAMIEIIDLEKTYALGQKPLTVIDKLNLSIQPGEFVSIIGPSGSGKSTLLHMIGGLDRPTSGHIKVNGQELSKLGDSKLSRFRNQNLGFVFQDFHLLDYLNLEQNIALPFRIKNQHDQINLEQQQQLDLLLLELGLTERRHHLPKQLSGGQKQRTAIGRALIMQPGILLADEPTGNLDSSTGKKIIELIRQIHQEKGLTTIIVTHDSHIAETA